MKSIKIPNPCLVTLETGKIGQIVEVGICPAYVKISFGVVFYSFIKIGYLFNILLFKIFLI